jgi:hypothetical protein
VLTFTSPWPAEFIDDECELYRRMSTDAPSGDAQQGEEAWTPDRVLEMDQWLAEQGVAKLVAVARHRDSGRLVAFSELGLPGDHPGEAWQWATLVSIPWPQPAPPPDWSRRVMLHAMGR